MHKKYKTPRREMAYKCGIPQKNAMQTVTNWCGNKERSSEATVYASMHKYWEILSLNLVRIYLTNQLPESSLDLPVEQKQSSGNLSWLDSNVDSSNWTQSDARDRGESLHDSERGRSEPPPWGVMIFFVVKNIVLSDRVNLPIVSCIARISSREFYFYNQYFKTYLYGRFFLYLDMISEFFFSDI